MNKSDSGLRGFLNSLLSAGRLYTRLFRRLIFAIFLAGFSLLQGGYSWAQPLEKVNLQLKWRHQFQFAGYYAAQAQGYYKAEGLDVQLLEGGSGHAPIASVVSGQAQYGIGDSDILLKRMQGVPLVAIASIFQHSPYVLLSRRDRGIHSVSDLLGKRVMLSDDQGLGQFQAMLNQEGVDPDKVKIIPHTWSLDDLIRGKVDAVSAYITVEPARMRERGVEPAILYTASYGTDFYGDTLFTMQSEIDQHPKRVNAFLRATKKGWVYALEHPEEIADSILKMDGVAQRGLTLQMLLHEAHEMMPLILPNVIEIGHMNPGRWSHIANTLAKTGIGPRKYSIDGFVYRPNPPLDPAFERWIVGLGIASALLIGLTLLWSTQLRRRVREQTQELQTEINDRIAMQNKLTQSEALLKVAGGVARVAGWIIEVADRHVIWSDEMCAFHEMPPGYAPSLEEALGFFSADARPRAEELMLACMTDAASFDEELQIVTVRGRSIWVRAIGQPVCDKDGNVKRIHGALQDISRRKEYEKNIQHLALYDHLTDLPNRKLLVDQLVQVLESNARTRRYGSLLFIDLDNFKSLNDTLGHDLGDQLLQQAAGRLTQCIRKKDLVARLGGDEFVVVLDSSSPNLKDAEIQAKIVAEKILTAFQHPFQLEGYEQYSTPSIGVVLFDGQLRSVETLLKRADLAMYEAKAAGRNTIRFFDPQMEAKILARTTLEAGLRNGLQRQEFQLYYQPQIGTDGKISGVEALLRWFHPQKGMVSPGEFIPIAEETGLIIPLGHWVLETACRQLLKWALNPIMSSLTIAVNVSARQFRHPKFLDEVTRLLDQTGVDARKLKLEITESVLLDNQEEMISKMLMLKLRGVGFALDDFGTGYSSLFYLKRLPLDQLKIDQSFVRDALTDPNDAVIARTIVGLGQSLGLDVIAEGVETEEQREFLARHGCRAYQGFLFSGALPVERLEAFVLAEYSTASIVARCK